MSIVNRAPLITVNKFQQPYTPASGLVPGSGNRPVLITPLSTGPSISVLQATPVNVVERIFLKAVTRKDKGNPKMFTLRNLDCDKIVSCGALKKEIRNQLKEDVVSSDFDVGFLHGSSVITIRNSVDLADIWADVKKAKKVTLWCDGLKAKCKGSSSRTHRDDDDDDTDEENFPPRKKKKVDQREEKVQNYINKLQEKHEGQYTPMQIRIWSEMVAGGLHSSFDDPPESSMFTKAGRSSSGAKKGGASAVGIADALTKAAVAITSVISPKPPASSQPLHVGSSPAKQIESRSKCYKQLHDLNALKVSGIISNEEYEEEKTAIMDVLKNLKSGSK